MPKPPVVVLAPEQRSQLESVARSRTSEQRAVERARIVLLAADGVPNRQIADRLGVEPDTVSKWRSRFATEGMAGLADRPRPGRPLVYGHDARLKVIRTVTETAPTPASHWSGRQVAEALAGDVGISRSQVWRILDGLDLKPHQVASWLTSHDPAFWEKAADVCGLYLSPPDNALVLSVDEKTQIQAKAPVNPTVPACPGIPALRDAEYVRHGTACLFAALSVHTGEVVFDLKDRNTSDDFLAFVAHLDQVSPPDLVLHLVLDNGGSHISNKTREWLAEQPGRFQVHHTPTHASWLNQVELFFSILGRRLIRRGEFASVEELVQKITAFIEDYNRRAKPFRWTYEGKPLRIA